MAHFLLKKSFQLETLKPIPFNDLWGCKGVFSTIRVDSKKNNYILLKEHITNINISLKKLKINFVLTENNLMLLIASRISKIPKNNYLLRVAINYKIISISLRLRLSPLKNFQADLYSYKRSMPEIKNLNYKKIINLLANINTEKKEIILHKNNIVLEGCTTNIICVRNKIIFTPKNNIYKGLTMTYLLNETKRVTKKTNILLNNLHSFDEILLVGSGKGVISLSSISKMNWKPKSNIVYKELLSIYKKLT